MKRKLIDIIGWTGVGAILSAYFLLNFDVISTKTLLYPLLNLGGALCIIVEAGYKKDAQPVVLNLVWLGVAVAALVRLA